jgi:hypothetical protein
MLSKKYIANYGTTYSMHTAFMYDKKHGTQYREQLRHLLFHAEGRVKDVYKLYNR